MYSNFKPYRKNHTHVKKVGTPQNFFLAFIDEIEKQLFIKKTVEVEFPNDSVANGRATML